ncbi:acetate kinase [Sulfurospirillum diekertiae]|uniref:Acetate kinase n=1 Tax=Sulfurospirillum diekertiae TaxID=1854492 RepID=A0A290HV74_9BACT|nr:acetate kinase [Sulfurospirillum diekertiae]ATB69570.1 acetate kinase [Sulfurospirillum diekertiae]
MKILVLNAGSSSVKYQLFNMANNEVLASGVIEQIGEKESMAKIKYKKSAGDEQKREEKCSIHDHDAALTWMSEALIQSGVIHNLNDLDGIGHRVVQGGSSFQEPAMVDDYVMSEIERLIPLGPLHNPGHLAGMKVSVHQSPNVPQVAVFDTAFHSTLPNYAYMYAIPYKYYEELRIRRYGFHGTSHYYVTKVAAKYLKQDINTLNAITLHLGNGASVAAIENGQSVDTSMGLTPLEGLIMGTRSGDLDPAILFYLARKRGLTLDELDKMLNKESGLKGICGSNDMREITRMAEEGDERAQLACDMFNYRLKKYIGSYSAVLGRVDCIIFTGGIGENANDVRLKSCEKLENFGIKIDPILNSVRSSEIRTISADDSKVKVLVIPTNEELEIAIETLEMIQKHHS